MGRYGREPANLEKSAKARGSQLRTHYKNTHVVGMFIKGMELGKAQTYLEQVLEFKRAIPFTKHRAGAGRHAQAKQLDKKGNAPGDQVGWPVKSTKYVLDLLTNLKANAESKGLNGEKMVIRHVQVNQAIKMRRRTYRAHGRINPYMCSPCHIEMFAEEKGEKVEKEAGEAPLVSRKRMAQLRLQKVPVGGGH